jgi:glycosyltransferase involved in cell wall biosynthesis
MIVCNARTLSAPLTGIQRYLRELLGRLPAGIETVEPTVAFRGGGLSGHVWEQTILPLEARGHLLWSPAGTGPALYRHQVVTVHDLAPLDCPEGFSPTFRRWYGWLWRQLLPRVPAILSVSEFTKRRLVEEFDLTPDKIHVTLLGVDHDRFFPQDAAKVEALRRKLSLPDRFVVFLGALSARKNISRLLEAWSRNNRPDVQLLIAGGSGQARAMAGTKPPALPPNTRVLGKIDDADVPTLMTAAEAFAYPSLYEGFGLPPLEAMACGTPCLVSNVTSLPEITADAAVQVDPLDVGEIARGLDRILCDAALREELRKKGLERAARFTWNDTAAKTYQVLSRYENG